MALKDEKIAFVSGLTGTTLSEVYLLTLTLLCGYFLRCCCLVSVPSLYARASSSLVASFLLEYLTIVFPAILVFTVLADHAAYVLLIELSLCASLAIAALSRSPSSNQTKSKLIKNALSSHFPSRHPYITVTRTFVNLFTAVAILAVDFSIYPRRLAKAETFGSGMMDIGVGAFLMAHGLTSPEARRAGSSSSSSNCSNSSNSSSNSSSSSSGTSKGDGVRKGRSLYSVGGSVGLVIVTLRQVLPLLVLGGLRLVSVKATDYQEHVTEYGVHWNFFFTIAAVRVLCSLLHPLLEYLPYGYGVVAVTVAALYQVLLQWGGLESYVLLGPDGDGSRLGMLSANREGIVSCIGYLAIYTGWIQIGRWLFKPRKAVRDFLQVEVFLVAMFLCLWMATSWSQQQIHPVSRRLVNISYILWIFSFGAMTLSTTLLIDIVILLLSNMSGMPRPPPYSSSGERGGGGGGGGRVVTTGGAPPLCVCSAVDYNQLTFFLLANVLTGAVNFSVDTLHAGAESALAVLAGYMATLTVLFMTLHRYKVKIKL